MSTPKAQPMSTPILPARVLSDGIAVTFPCGGTATISPYGDGFTYEARKADGTAVSWAGPAICDRERALRMAWGAVCTAPPALALDAADVHALALSCDRDVKLFAKTLKRLLRARTGVSFSVTRGRGTASGWVDVSTQPGGGDLSAAGEAMLRSIFGDLAHGGMSVRPRGGERVRVICDAAGFPLPDGFVVQPPDWD